MDSTVGSRKVLNFFNAQHPTYYISKLVIDVQQVGMKISHWAIKIMITVNPFVLNAPFLYSLKESENFAVFWYFQGVEKGCTGNKSVNNKSIKYSEPRDTTELQKVWYHGRRILLTGIS